MNTLILYATKYGTTREIAQRISNNIDNFVMHDLKQGDIPNLGEFDCVIIGSSLYAGTIRKEAKTFLSQNTNDLQNKKIGLFLCGIDESNGKKYFDDNFPADILRVAQAKSFLGGIFEPQKANVFERLIMKAVAKQPGHVNTVNDEKVKQFSDVINRKG